MNLSKTTNASSSTGVSSSACQKLCMIPGCGSGDPAGCVADCVDQFYTPGCESQADAFYTSGLVLDDGVIDPRDTRAVLAFCLDTCAEAAARQPRPMQFGVARM